MKTKPGIALITVMGIFLILSLLAIALIQAIAGYVSLSERMIRRVKAHYLAEAGINDAMMKMFHRTWGYPLAGDFNYTLSIQTSEGTKQVIVTIDQTSGGPPYRITASSNI